MAGITPNEGETYVAGKVYVNGNLRVGLWTGTWNLQENVIYIQGNSQFTKITADGYAEVTLNNWTISDDTATHPDVLFTAGAGVTVYVSGYYIATEDNRLLHIERGPEVLERSEGQSYRVILSNVVA